MKSLELFGTGIASLSPFATAERRLNCFYEIRDDGDQTKILIRGTPGLTLFATLPSGNIRGWHVANNTLYCVSGQYLYSITIGGAVTLIPTSITPGTGQVGIADNGQQLLIADGFKLWVYTLTANSTTTWAPATVTFVPSTAGFNTVAFSATPTFTPATTLGITAGNYTMRISVDGSAANLYSVAATGADTMSSMALLIQQAINKLGAVSSTGTFVGGSGYLDGTYLNVPMTGGTGTGALGNFTISTVAAAALVPGSTYTIKVVGTTDWVKLGASSNTIGVTFVTNAAAAGTGTANLWTSSVSGGQNYVNGDVLSASNTNLGGAGAGFNLTVTATTPAITNVTVVAVGTGWVITSGTLGKSSFVVVTVPAASGTDLIGAINTAKTATATHVSTAGTSPFTSGAFVVTGDQTTMFPAGTRLQLTEFAGTVITTVSGSVFAAGNTTVTVSLGSVDQLLTAVSIGTSPAIGTLVQVTSPAITQAMSNGANKVTYQDGFFLLAVPLTQQFYKSSLYDGTTWAPLDFASKQSQPDLLQAIDSLNSTIILWGDKSIEFWQNTGAFPFPFQRINGATVNWGLAATNSRAYSNNTMMFLGQNQQGSLQVVMLNGHTPQRVSTHDIEHIITSMPVYADATAMSYIIDGHIMYEITFPTANRSFLYDSLTQMWSEVQTGISNIPQRHLSNLGINFNASNYVTDSSGNIFLLDQTNATDNGAPIQRVVTSRHIRMSGDDFGIDFLYIDMDIGVGLNSGQGVNPMITLEVSKDFGNTWPVNRPTSMGAMGEFAGPRVKWNRIGASTDYVFRFTCTDPVPFLILNGAAVIRQGTQK